jgi:adenosylcobinamide-GDP ribazoletransferase
LESKLNDQIILGNALFLSRLPVPDHGRRGEIDRYVRGSSLSRWSALLGGLSGLVFLAVQSWCGLPLARCLAF